MKEKEINNEVFVHPLPEGSLCVSPNIDVLDYCRVEQVSDDSVFLRNDASLLFHLADVEKKYGATVANSLTNRTAVASSLQSSMDNLTDDELFRTIVPRHIQSPSEVKMFTEQLGAMAEEELSRLDSLKSELDSASPSSSSDSVNSSSE